MAGWDGCCLVGSGLGWVGSGVTDREGVGFGCVSGAEPGPCLAVGVPARRRASHLTSRVGIENHNWGFWLHVWNKCGRYMCVRACMHANAGTGLGWVGFGWLCHVSFGSVWLEPRGRGGPYCVLARVIIRRAGVGLVHT